VVQWLLEKGAEVDAKNRVRGDPMGQGDPEGLEKGLWGTHSRAGMQLFLSKPWPLGGLYRGAAAV